MPVFHGLPDDSDDSPVEIRMINMPLNSRPGTNFTGPPPVPDPLYFELKDEVEGMCLVATSWIESFGNHIYTRQMREDIEEFQFKMTMFLTSLEYPKPASETPPLDDFGNVRTTKEEFWEHLKDEYDTLKRMSDNIRTAPKRVRRTPSGDEAPNRMNNFLSSQTTGSSSQRAPTSAPPPITVGAEDTDADHHAQPSGPTSE
jgi:hypothetical protein